MKKDLIKNTFLTLIALSFLGSTNIIFNIIIGRYHGSLTLGKVSIAISASFFFSTIIRSGISSSTTKFISEYLGKKDKNSATVVFKTNLKITLIFTLVLTIIALLLSPWLSSKLSITNWLFISAIPLISLKSLHIFYKGVYYGSNKIKDYLKIEILSDILFFIILAIVLIFFESFLLFPYIIMYFIFFIFSFHFFKKDFVNQAPYTKVPKGVYSFAIIATIGTVSSLGRSYLSIIFSGIYLTSSEVGFFTAAFSLSTILYFFSTGVSKVIFPTFSKLYGKNDLNSINKILNIATKWFLIIISFFCGLLFIFSEFIFEFFFGNDFILGTASFQILLLGVLFSIIQSPANTALSGTKYVHIPNIGGVLGLIVSTISWIFLIPKYGIEGTAFGYILGSISTFFIVIFFANKYFDLKNSKLLFISGINLLLFIICVSIMFFFPFLPNIFASLVFVVAFILIYRKDIIIMSKEVLNAIF